MSSKANYPTRQLGTNGPQVSAIGFGAMGIGAFYGQTDEAEAWKTLTRAADLGVTFWDTSDGYGSSEATLGRWFTETGRRSEIFLATKFGGGDQTPGAANPYKPNSKPAYIRGQLAASLKALQTDYIDLYYQHRVDPEVPIEVVMETLRPFLEEGKIKWIGLSECSPAVLKRAKSVKGVGEKVVAAQMEFSPLELSIEKTGFVKASRELGVAIVAYSPVARGFLSGAFRSPKDFGPGDLRPILPRFSEENFAKNLKVVDKFQVLAKKLNATPSQVALAWILAEHDDFFPIPGTRSVARLEENAQAALLELSPAEVQEIRKFAEEADVNGDRYPEQFLASTQGNCIELSEWKGHVQ